MIGKRVNNNNWIYEIIVQALKKGNIQHESNGEEIREYLHIKDAAKVCVDILAEKYKNDDIFLTGLQAIKIKDLLLQIKEALNSEATIEFLNQNIEEYYTTTPYTFRPRVAKKFIPNTQLDLGQGILDTIYDVYKGLYKSIDEKLIVS